MKSHLENFIPFSLCKSVLTAETGNLPRAVVSKLHCGETDTQITKIGGIKMEKTTMSVQELSEQMGISLPKKINDWLQEHPKLIGREVCIINKYQIKIRKTYLGYSDKAELFSIIEKSENNNYRAGAFILLGEFDEAKKIFDSYGEEQMQEFINYPIYTLYQQSGENLM